jgi:Ni,Fe-hydrogenase III component G
MTTRNYESELTALFPGGELRKSADGYFWVNVGPDQLRAAVTTVREKLGITHLSTIVGEDIRDHFLLSYPLSGEVVVVLQVKVNREKPEIPSLAAVVPGSLVYERELRELFGITPIGHPDLRRQVLPEDWPEGVYPLRKDVVLPRASAEPEGGEVKNG